MERDESGFFGRGAAQALLKRAVQAIAKVLGEGQRLGVAEDLDGFPRRIDQQPAIVAMAQMNLDLLDRGGIQLAVKKIAQLIQDGFTVHSLATHFCRPPGTTDREIDAI